jgi:hypothetical protein
VCVCVCVFRYTCGRIIIEPNGPPLPTPSPKQKQSAVGRGLRILLGLLTGSDAGTVRLALGTLRGTLLVATGGACVDYLVQ